MTPPEFPRLTETLVYALSSFVHPLSPPPSVGTYIVYICVCLYIYVYDRNDCLSKMELSVELSIRL